MCFHREECHSKKTETGLILLCKYFNTEVCKYCVLYSVCVFVCECVCVCMHVFMRACVHKCKYVICLSQLTDLTENNTFIVKTQHTSFQEIKKCTHLGYRKCKDYSLVINATLRDTTVLCKFHTKVIDHAYHLS